MSIFTALFGRSNPFDKLSGSHKKWVIRIHGVLSPNLLKPKYRRELDDRDYASFTFGHCYVAAEAAYHLFAKDEGFVPYMAKACEGQTHWWLVNERTEEIIDPTFPQLRGDYSLYKNGKRRPFLTKLPSKRARELMRRVRVS